MKSLLNKISRLHLLVVGDVMLDHYIWGDTNRISPEAPVPVIDVTKDTYSAGGAANVALNITSLGAKATIAGFFGRDDSGTLLRGIITQKGIDTIATPGNGSTIVKTRLIVRRQQLCRLDRESPLHSYQIDPSHIDVVFSKIVPKVDAVILSDYAKGLLSDELVARISALAREHKKFLAIDPKPRRKLKFFQPDLLTPNRKESLQLAGLDPSRISLFPPPRSAPASTSYTGRNTLSLRSARTACCFPRMARSVASFQPWRARFSMCLEPAIPRSPP